MSKKWTPDDDVLLKSLANSSKSYKEFEKTFKLTWTTIKQRMKLLGVFDEHWQLIEERRALRKSNKFRCIWCRNLYDLTTRFTTKVRAENCCIPCKQNKRRERLQKFKANATLKMVLNHKLRYAKNTCQKMKRDFSIDAEHLMEIYDKQKGLCYYSNLPMHDKLCSPWTVSIDRVDSNAGYTAGNIVLCCAIINSMKLDLTVEEFKKYIKLIHENRKNY